MILTTEITENFARVKMLYSSVCELSYPVKFRTARAVSHALVNVYGVRMLITFVPTAKSTKYTKINRVQKFLRLQ